MGSEMCIRDSQSIFARTASAVKPSEKSSIITNRKSTTRFPMSLLRTSYAAYKPLPPKKGGSQKRKMTDSSIKVDFFRGKSATKFLCAKTVSGKVVRHSLAYLTVHKWLAGDVLFYMKFWAKVTHPFKNGDFQSIFARSTSTVTPSKKVQLSLMGSPPRAFQRA